MQPNSLVMNAQKLLIEPLMHFLTKKTFGACLSNNTGYMTCFRRLILKHLWFCVFLMSDLMENSYTNWEHAEI